MPELDPSLARLAKAYRNVRGPEPGRVDQLCNALEGRLAAGELPRPESDPGALPEVVSTGAAPAAKLALTVAAVGAVGLGAWSLAPDEAPTEPAQARPIPVVEAIASPEPVVEEEPAAPAVVEQQEPRMEPPRVRPPRSGAPRKTAPPTREAPPPAPETPAKTGIDAEIDLLGRASMALKAGDAKKALRLVRDHARLYPKSELTETREVTRARALRALGRVDEACALRDEFVTRWPSSPYRHRVDAACDGGPSAGKRRP